MNRKYLLIPALVWGLNLTITAADSRITADQFPLVVEAEVFSIRSGRIVSDKEASNGQAVLSESLSFHAGIMVNFKHAGRYQLTLYEKAVDGSKDSIHIGVNNESPLRTYPDVAAYGSYAPCKKTALINLIEPGDVAINLFTTNEYGSYYDKVVIEIIK